MSITSVQLCTPTSRNDFARYYQLRWELLRAPWQQPKGSEQDEFESSAFHIMAINENDHVIGVGRLHSPGHRLGQIRYMAVCPEEQSQGIGSRLLRALEEAALQKQYRRLILNARDSAVAFYLQHGYRQRGKGPTLYGQITHTELYKELLT